MTRRVFSAAVVAGLMWACVTSTAGAATLFADDFNDGNDSGWSQVNRCWQVIGGIYRSDGGYGCNGVPLTGFRDAFSYTHVGDATWTDYVVDFDFDTSNPSGSPAGFHDAAVMWRVGGPLADPHGADSQYRIDFIGDGAGHTAKVNVSKFLPGPDTEALVVEQPAPVPVGWAHGRIVVEGGHIQVFLNGVPVVDITDPAPLPSGGIGLGGVWEVDAGFDNVVVTSVGGGGSVALTKADCKGDGWRRRARGNGSTFKNQGDCISFVATGR